MPLPLDAKLLVAAFTTSGVVHLVRPQAFEPLIPAWVHAHREVIVASGVSELLCASGLLWPRTRPVAGYASAALLVGVFPGNLKMAQDASRSSRTGLKAAAYARLPLQVPMVRAALRAARS